MALKSSKVKLSLPTSPNDPPDSFEEFTTCIFGRKGIGKTTLASQFDDALVFMFERGRRNLSILQVPNKKGEKLNWTTFKQYRDLFLASKHQTAVIDTIDRCYELALKYVCQKEGVSHPSNAGSDAPGLWDRAKYEFEEVIGSFQDAGKGLVLISHDRSKTTPNRDNTEHERVEPTCKPAAYAIIQTICDFVLHYDYSSNGDRILTIRNLDNTIWCSCGVNDAFLDPDGNPLYRFQLPHDPKEGYKTLLAAYAGEIRDYDYTPPKKSIFSGKKKKKKSKKTT